MMNPYQQVNDSQVERLAGTINGYSNFLGDFVIMGLKVAADLGVIFSVVLTGMGVTDSSSRGCLLGGPLLLLVFLYFEKYLFDLHRGIWLLFTGAITTLLVYGGLMVAFHPASNPATVTGTNTTTAAIPIADRLHCSPGWHLIMYTDGSQICTNQ